MLSTIQEYNQWLKNYDLLLEQARRAFVLGQQEVVYDINERILNTQVQIAICAKRLKEESKANPRNSVRSSVSRDVKVSKNPSV
jgi:hypothetical protein